MIRGVFSISAMTIDLYSTILCEFEFRFIIVARHLIISHSNHYSQDETVLLTLVEVLPCSGHFSHDHLSSGGAALHGGEVCRLNEMDLLRFFVASFDRSIAAVSWVAGMCLSHCKASSPCV